jgi:hypothetical protein
MSPALTKRPPVLAIRSFRDKNLRLIARDIIGDDLAEQISDVWNVNSEGEVRGVWRPCGRALSPGCPRSASADARLLYPATDERFIITAGDVAISRFYSHIVAQQLLQSHYGVRLPAFDTSVADLAASYEKSIADSTLTMTHNVDGEVMAPPAGASVAVGA